MGAGDRFDETARAARARLLAAARSAVEDARAGGSELPEGVEACLDARVGSRCGRALSLALWAAFRAGCDGAPGGRPAPGQFDALAGIVREDARGAALEVFAAERAARTDLPEDFEWRAAQAVGHRAAAALVRAAEDAYLVGVESAAPGAVAPHERPTRPPPEG